MEDGNVQVNRGRMFRTVGTLEIVLGVMLAVLAPALIVVVESDGSGGHDGRGIALFFASVIGVFGLVGLIIPGLMLRRGHAWGQLGLAAASAYVGWLLFYA